jgi:hypothetical protein
MCWQKFQNLNYIHWNWKLIENMSTCIVEISWHLNYNYVMLDSTLYYTSIQTLNVLFALVWFSFLLFFFRPNLWLKLNPCNLSIHDFFQMSHPPCLLHVGNFKSHFEGLIFHYQFISRYFYFFNHMFKLFFKSVKECNRKKKILLSIALFWTFYMVLRQVNVDNMKSL